MLLLSSTNYSRNKRPWKTSSFPIKIRQNDKNEYENFMNIFTSPKFMQKCSRLNVKTIILTKY